MKKRDERNINKNNEMNEGQRRTERMEGERSKTKRNWKK